MCFDFYSRNSLTNREWSPRRSCAGRHGVKYQQNGADRRIELFVCDVKGVLQIRWFSGCQCCPTFKISSCWLWLRTLNSNNANYYVFWFLQQEFINTYNKSTIWQNEQTANQKVHAITCSSFFTITFHT
jgi:hypothetical protein